MDNQSHNEILAQHIKQYLTCVASHLHGASRQSVEDNLEEIRQHLTTSSETLIAAGLSADQAAQRAIQRFGSSDKVGASLARHLTPYDFPITVYRMLGICHFTQIAACILGTHELLRVPAWAAFALVMSICIIVLVVEEDRRFTVRSKSIPEFCRHIGRIQRELERANIAKIANLSGSRLRFYLFQLAWMSFMFTHYHIYVMVGFFAASVVEFVLIRRTASRLGANIPA